MIVGVPPPGALSARPVLVDLTVDMLKQGLHLHEECVARPFEVLHPFGCPSV